MKKIIPALLTKDRNQMQQMLNTCANFTDYVQIDIMDGLFVPSLSINCEDVSQLQSPVGSEAHLMVQNPLDWLGVFKKIGSTRIIFHAEVKGDCEEIIRAIRNEGFEAGIAINPLTPIKKIEFLIEKIDVLLFMSVHPGFYGAPFIPEVLEKIKAFKQLYPDIIASIDGGVKLENVGHVALSGVDCICVGSAILKAEDPAKAYKNMVMAVS